MCFLHTAAVWSWVPDHNGGTESSEFCGLECCISKALTFNCIGIELWQLGWRCIKLGAVLKVIMLFGVQPCENKQTACENTMDPYMLWLWCTETCLILLERERNHHTLGVQILLSSDSIMTFEWCTQVVSYKYLLHGHASLCSITSWTKKYIFLPNHQIKIEILTKLSN